MPRTLIAAATLAALALPAAALADTRAGVDAWTRGDYATAVREWQAQAARGDADAMFDLGQAYKLGKGVKPDLAMAEALYGKAAALGHLQASDNYGLLLFQRGEHAQALPYIRAAADRGDPRAQYILGIAHFNGDMVPKDYVRAYALMSLARQAGLPQAGAALQQMDKYVPLADRQQAATMAQELASEAQATRARQMAAVDLGSQVPGGAGPVPPVPAPALSYPKPPPPAMASGNPGLGLPPSAGTDYTRDPYAAAPAPAPETGMVPEETPSPGPRPHPHPAAHPAPAASGGGSWRIQFGAFGVAANADALWRKVAGRPEVAGHPRINLHSGNITRLLAGGYSESSAHAACSRLSASGITCVPVR